MKHPHKMFNLLYKKNSATLAEGAQAGRSLALGEAEVHPTLIQDIQLKTLVRCTGDHEKETHQAPREETVHPTLPYLVQHEDHQDLVQAVEDHQHEAHLAQRQ